MRKQAQTLFIALAMAIFTLAYVFAAVPGGATVSNALDLGEYPNFSAGTVDIEAGNITQANVDANTSTFRWAGLTGNVTGTLVLGDLNSNVFFTWVAEGNLVYASTASSVEWTALADATASNVEANFTHLGVGSDNYSNTFTGGSESIGSNIFTISSDHAVTQPTASDWTTYSLGAEGDIVFAGRVETDLADYRGQTSDYQLILPENGDAGDTTATTWYMWVELE